MVKLIIRLLLDCRSSWGFEANFTVGWLSWRQPTKSLLFAGPYPFYRGQHINRISVCLSVCPSISLSLQSSAYGESPPANPGYHVFFASLTCDRGVRDEVEPADS